MKTPLLVDNYFIMDSFLDKERVMIHQGTLLYVAALIGWCSEYDFYYDYDESGANVYAMTTKGKWRYIYDVGPEYIEDHHISLLDEEEFVRNILKTNADELR